MKAWLMAHPTYLTGVSANDTLPSNVQGYGMPNLQAMFGDTPTFVLNQTQVLADSGQTWTWVGAVADPTKPLRISLAYTDAAGAIGTSPQVNNLDLEVEVGTTTYLGNRFTGQWSTTGGVPDIRNNYEAVFLPSGTDDSVTITVRGFAIGGDGVPGNADTTDQDFAITCSNCAQTPTFTLQLEPTSLSVCTNETSSAPFNITTGSILGFTTAATFGVSGNPAGTGATFSVNPVPTPGNSVLTVDTLGSAAAGTYPIAITGTAGSEVKSRTTNLTLYTDNPAAFALTAPVDTAMNVALSPVLSWAASAQAAGYAVQIATDATFTNIVYSGNATTTTHTVGTALASNMQYFWRVIALNECGDTLGTAAFSFTTLPLPGDCAIGSTPTVVYSTDFEGDNSAWTISGSPAWATSGARTHSGVKAFLGQDVTTASDQRLVSPAIVLPSGQTPLSLLFWNHQTIEDRTGGCYDGALLEVSTNAGSSWTQMSGAQLLVGPYTGPIAGSNPAVGLQAWCGDPQDWTRYVVDLDSYAGQTVQFRFRMTTDGSVGRLPDGFYLDDVSVQACSAVSLDMIFADGFEVIVP